MEDEIPTISSRYISAVIRFRWLIIGAWFAVTAAAGCLYLTKFRIDNSVAIWFLEDDPELASYRESLETFGEREWTYLWLKTDSVFAPEFLRDLQDLAARIGELDHVHRTVAITDARGTQQDDAGRQQAVDYYGSPRGEVPSVSEIAELKAGLGRSPLYSEALLVAGDETFTILAVQNDNLIREIEPYRIQLIDRVHELVARYPTIADSGLVGTTVVNAELNRAAERDMFVYYSLIAAFVLLVGSVVLRYRRDLLVLIAVLVGTVVPVMGCAATLGLSFNLMTIMLPTLLVTVSVSYLIHFLNEFHLQRATGRAPAEALGGTVSTLIRPGIWTSVTTVIGFVSLTASAVAPIRQVGWLAALGIGMAWLTTFTIAPLLLHLLWGKSGATRRGASVGARFDALLLKATRPRPLVVLGFGAAVAIAASALPRLGADTNYVEFFKPGSDVRQDYDQLVDIGLPQSSLDITITFPNGSRFADLERHRELLSFEGELARLPEVRRIESLSRIVRLMHEDLSGGPNGDARQLAVLLMLAEGQMMPEAEEFISADGNTIRLRVMTDYMGTDALTAFRAEIDKVIDRALPGDFKTNLSGTTLLWANMDEQVIRTQLLTIAITGAAMLIILPIAFRSVLLGLLGFVVSFIPILCTLGIMAWVGLPVNIASCILGGVVIGLSVDDTIYFASRIRDSLGRGSTVDEAVRQATLSSGRAMVKTSVVLSGGFLTMTASDFLPSVYFGLFFAASIIVALLADLLLLPALLRRCARFLEMG
jgi:predicted RND superfamily exporter protein